MAAAMAVLLALQVTQQRSIRKSSDLRSDSITALAFQLEREFLRLRQALELHAQSEVPKPLNELRLRRGCQGMAPSRIVMGCRSRACSHYFCQCEGHESRANLGA